MRRGRGWALYRMHCAHEHISENDAGCKAAQAECEDFGGPNTPPALEHWRSAAVASLQVP